MKHGYYKTSIYNIWKLMRKRCSNPNDPYYHRYGGRGIRVCKRWDAFEAFLSDMGERPEGKKLDRIDNDGDYTPGNCRWVTQQEQNYNMTTNHDVTIGGMTMCVSAWSKLSGVHRSTIRKRISNGVTGIALIASTEAMNKPDHEAQ